MKLGIHFARMSFPGGPARLAPTLAETATIADERGVEWFTMMDHWFQIPTIGSPEEQMLEGYTSLGFVAAQTSRIKLGLLVAGVTYRYPGLLAKLATTLDILSQGRAIYGIGAAWFEEEHRGLGVPYPPLSERFLRMEEAILIAQQMWSDNDGPFNGTYYQLERTLNSPQPLSSPHPPILIGGSGERKTLRYVAQYGDACNIIATSPEQVQHKLDVLRAHCDDVGRDYNTIYKTVLRPAPAIGETDAWLTEMAGYAGLGIDLVTMGADGQDPVRWADEFTAVAVPALDEIQ